MSGDEPFNAAEIGVRLASALESAGVPHAVGGALAYGVWALPRATKDVDLNVFVEPDRLEAALDALASAGVDFDRERATREALDGGLAIGWVGACQVDVFVPSIPFSWEALRTRARGRIGGIDVWVLSAEAIAIFKLLFFRSKDIPDLERLIAAQGKRLDAPYVRRWIADMMGEDDARVAKWDELCATFWREPPSR